MEELPRPLVERILAHHPVPIADAVGALVSAEGPHERRDRVVEAFRAVARSLAAIALAARFQRGAPAGGDSPEVKELLRGLRQRGLTDGQWVGLTRELCRPLGGGEGPGAKVAALFQSSEFTRALEGLLAMRKAETVAHGATGDERELAAILERRLPQLEAVLKAIDPVCEAYRWCVPLAEPLGDVRQRAYLLAGDTPARGRWARIELAARATPGEVVLIDAAGKPVTPLPPIVQFRRPTPEAPEELFFFEGTKKTSARYVALPSMAEHRAEDVIARLDEVLLGSREEVDDAGASTAARPYRGLESFQPEHAALFFGRSRLAEVLANRIRAHPLVTVTGASGSGKTSLLNAGVLPRLSEFVAVRVRPGGDPVAALKGRLGAALGVTDDVLVAAARGDRKLLVVVDQSEELFTLGASEEAVNAFAAAICALTADPDGPVRVVLSVREDFFARLASIPAWKERSTRQVEVISAPSREELIEAVVRPAEQFGFAFEDEALVGALLAPVEREPGALALLQFCADQLWDARDRAWKRLTWEAYRALGGVEGALARHAEATLSGLTPAEQTLAKGMFLRLVTAERTRAIVPRDELIGPAGATPVLERLIASRLVSIREGERGEATVELVHEALIRYWARLQGWLDEDGDRLKARSRVIAAARQWRDEGRRADLLLGDGRPVEDGALLLHSREHLSADEAAFIHASLERARLRLILKRAAILFLGWLASIVLVDKSIQYFGLPVLTGDLIKVVTGALLGVVGLIMVLRTKPYRSVAAESST